MNLTVDDINILESYWVQKARVNFFAFRQFIRYGNFIHNFFIHDLCYRLQRFYIQLVNNERPVLLIQAPPQHGKSWCVADYISWIVGLLPRLRIIYATYSDTLGKRCNLAQQRVISSAKYNSIFPGTTLSTIKGKAIRTKNHLEFLDAEGKVTDGQFRNVSAGGGVVGESLDLGIIDDVVKGREQANSPVVSQKIWEWYTDDFGTRFSDKAGLLVIMTRWSVNDIIGRLIEIFKELKVKYDLVNYQAEATEDDEHRKVGEPLFPELKSKEFLTLKKKTMLPHSWNSLYQGKPTIVGGNLIKDNWWEWWRTGTSLPIKFKFITADTAQKEKTKNDWTVFQCWGYGRDDRIYMLDKLRGKFDAPSLRHEAAIFYNKHNTPRKFKGDPILRGMYIEDKSSGTGLIQELKKKRMKVVEVKREIDKYTRYEDAGPEIQAGRVVLNTDISDIGNTTKEGREFPNSEFDDDIDTLFTAVEVAFLNKKVNSSLRAAMGG